MTRTSSPGKRTEGFATLDALMAVLVFSIALGGIAGWTGALRTAAIKREARLEKMLLEATERDGENWIYDAQTDPAD